MSQRTEKVARLIQQITAAELSRLPESAQFTITRADVSPDLREATVWVGVVVSDPDEVEKLFKKHLYPYRKQFQEAVARGLSTKFVPRLSFKRDASGAYADEITRLIRGL